MVGVDTSLRVLLVVSLLLAVLALARLGDGRWRARVRSRLLLGVPWGTLVTLGLVLAVYLLLQDGLTAWRDPLTLPYVSWSYLYPTGWLLAPFAHDGPGHLLGNLVGAGVLGAVAEYAWGHYPRSRGTASFDGLRRNPFLRALFGVPVAALVVGLATSLFHWGPIIGFSGVVYALAGVGLVTFPLTTVVALAARSAVSTTVDAALVPRVVATPGPSFGGPWWAGIAVQGHVLGLVVGLLVGLVLVRRGRVRRPPVGRLWLAAVVAGFSLTLWAVWWYGEGEAVVLYRALGVALVFTLATVVAGAVRASSRDLLPRLGALGRLEVGVTRRRAATLVLVLALTTMALVAVPVNLSTVGSTDPATGAVEVRDYQVYYAEGVRDRNVPAVDVSLFGATTNVTTSGVIVVSERRHMWTRAVSAGQLGFLGYASVEVGGPGWSETVDVRRAGWVPTGADPVYVVGLRPPDGEFRVVFAAEAATAEPVVAGRNVTVGWAAAEDRFVIRVSREGTELGQAPVPETNSSVAVGGLTIRRLGDRLVAVAGETRVTVATVEEYA